MSLSEMDFSLEGNFQERLLSRIRNECFAELSDDDLGIVNAAGSLNSDKTVIVLRPDQIQRD